MKARHTSGSKLSTDRGYKSTVQPASFSSSLLSVGSSLKTAGSRAGRGLFQAVSAGYDHLTSDTSDKEVVLFVKFSQLELRSSAGVQLQPVLLLGYQTGFQVWDLQDCRHIHELVSRRDGSVRFIEPLPWPRQQPAASSPLRNAQPVLAVATAPETSSCTESDNTPSTAHCVQLYSMQSHTYVHTLRFNSRVLSLKCSPRFVVVALDAQIHAFGASSLQHTFCVVTYSVAAAVQGLQGDRVQAEHTAPMALGAAWLAYASNQAVTSPTVQATPLSPSHPSFSHTAGPRNGHPPSNYDSLSLYAKACAKQSGQQLKVLGEAGFKYLSGAVENWRAGSMEGAAAKASPGGDQGPGDPQLAGTVMVRDAVNRYLVAHFRAHNSPLLCLQFDPSGTLLVTASLHGHNIHIFHICLQHGVTDSSRSSAKPVASAVHLYRLARGVTPAVIRDVSFSGAGGWLGVSSARGTTHLFRLANPDSKDLDHQPAHLAAASLSRQHSRSATANGLLAGHEPIKLTAVGRARGAGLLNGGLPGSAAAAAVVNLYNGHPGGSDVAATFMPAQQANDSQAPQLSGLQAQPSALQEDLLVMTASAGLIRYRLKLQCQTAAEPATGLLLGDRRQEGGGAEKGWGRGGDPLALVAEPQERWDLCRHSTWPEREEVLCATSGSHDDTHSLASTATGPQDSPFASPHKGAFPRQTAAWMVHAETQTCSPVNTPLWADDQFAFLEFVATADGSTNGQQTRAECGVRQQPWCKVSAECIANCVKRVKQDAQFSEGSTCKVVTGKHDVKLNDSPAWMQIALEERSCVRVQTDRHAALPRQQPPTMMFAAPPPPAAAASAPIMHTTSAQPRPNAVADLASDRLALASPRRSVAGAIAGSIPS